MYANAHNWYAAPEQFGSDLPGTTYHRFLSYSFLFQLETHQGSSQVSLSIALTEIDWKAYENPTL